MLFLASCWAMASCCSLISHSNLLSGDIEGMRWTVLPERSVGVRVALLVLVVPFIRDLLVTWRRMLALAELRDNKTNRDEYLFPAAHCHLCSPSLRLQNGRIRVRAW